MQLFEKRLQRDSPAGKSRRRGVEHLTERRHRGRKVAAGGQHLRMDQRRFDRPDAAQDCNDTFGLG